MLALAAAWWPARLSGIFDGAPFDSAPDAIVLGLLLPALLWLVPAAARDRRTHVLVIALLAWKIFSSAALVQDGLCVRVMMPGHTAAVKNWDARTDWRSPDPQCSAIVDRPLVEDRQFPIWLPFSFSDTAPALPDATTVVAQLTMSGSISVDQPGTLRLWTAPSVDARLTVDGHPADAAGESINAGSHLIAIEATLRGEHWILAPLWNESSLFRSLTTTVAPPSLLDRFVRPWGNWIACVLVLALLLILLAHTLVAIRKWQVLAWIAASAAGGALIPVLVPGRGWHFVLLLLLAACAIRMPAGLRNVRGAFVLLAPAWLALNVIDTYNDQGFGRLDTINFGNDWYVFQRSAYLIYMDGFWLQGGENAFWFQPFYRWIAGALHMLFGQSQVGENYWDAIGVLILALFSFEATRSARGFRWGCAAAALVLVAFVSGPGYVFIGRGLSEISSAALISLAALGVIRARERQSVPLLLIASSVAVLGFWTRLNNLPMAVAVALFAWPLTEPSATLRKPKMWLANVWVPPLIVVPMAIALGMFLFALRTWHYTGHFSIFYGTQSALLAVWQDGMSFGEVARAMIDSVLMVATTTDPPSYHNGALPVMAGFALAVAALSGAGLVGRLPLPLVAFTLAAFASALIARGSAYSGRFSIHVLGASAAVVTCALAAGYERFTAGTTEARRSRGF